MATSEKELFYQREGNLELAAKLKKWAWVVSGLVFGLVLLMRRVKLPVPEGFDVSFLPPVHAGINGLAAIVLIGALVAVKCGRVRLHQKLMTAALGLSVLFLLSYVTYHFTTPETVFGETDGIPGLSDAEKAAVGGKRTFYLALLLPHILLAAVSLPFILITLIYAATNQYAKHRSIARKVYPIWLFVAVSGPICYWMLRPYY